MPTNLELFLVGFFFLHSGMCVAILKLFYEQYRTDVGGAKVLTIEKGRFKLFHQPVNVGNVPGQLLESFFSIHTHTP